MAQAIEGSNLAVKHWLQSRLPGIHTSKPGWLAPTSHATTLLDFPWVGMFVPDNCLSLLLL